MPLKPKELIAALKETDDPAIISDLLIPENLKSKSKHSSKAIHLAAESDEAGLVVMLLDAGVSITEKGYSNRTPLHYAAAGNATAVTSILLERGASKRKRDSMGITPLQVAARHNAVDVLAILIEAGVKIDAINKNGSTALSSAAERGHAGAVELLIESRAAINGISARFDILYSTPLYKAADRGRRDVVRLLLKHGARVDPEGECYNVTIALDPSIASTRAILSLVKQVKDKPKRDAEAYTALQRAALHGFHEIVDDLRTAGADTSIATKRGWTALHYAARSGSVKTVAALLKSWRNNNHVDKDDLTPLHVAVIARKKAVVETLLESDSTLIDDFHIGLYTPLHFAISVGSNAVVRLLLDRGADVNRSYENKLTGRPLYRALIITNCDPAIIRTLILAGAMPVLRSFFKRRFKPEDLSRIKHNLDEQDKLIAALKCVKWNGLIDALCSPSHVTLFSTSSTQEANTSNQVDEGSLVLS